MEIEYTSHFKNSYQKLDRAIQRKAEEREVLFRKNPFAPRIKTHKLRGRLKEFYSFSISRKHRVVFRFVSRDKAVFLDVGDHRVYQ